jgi:beta-lactamase regulating signal transducer with metallopeptidase domain
MNGLNYAISAALVHSLWQDALVALLLGAALVIMRNRTAAARYIAACAGLALMATLPVVTASVLYGRSIPTAFAPTMPLASARPDAATTDTIAALTAQIPVQEHASIALVQRWALPVWSVGVLVFSLRLLSGSAYAFGVRRRGEPAEEETTSLVARLARQIGITRPIAVLVSALPEGPATIGWLRPIVLLPPATALGLTRQQLEALLVHELAHVRRHDYLVNVFQMILESLFFYHPAIWWASNQIRAERELCCDDIAVASCGDSITYARALTSVARLRLTAQSVAVGAGSGPLPHRIRRLLNPAPDKRTSRGPAEVTTLIVLPTMALILALAVVPTALAQTGLVQLTTSVVSTNRLGAAESVIVTSSPARVARQIQEARLVASADHFDITSTPDLDGQAELVGRQAEQAYRLVAASLQHELSLRPLLVLYLTGDQAQRAVQTGTVPGNREHILVPLDTPSERLPGMLAHEVSHAFVFDILPASRIYQVPVWLMEGMAELHRGEWDPTDVSALRGILLTGTGPTLQTIEAMRQSTDKRQNYVIGHAMLDFLVARVGTDGPRRLLLSLRENLTVTPLDAYLAALGLAPDEFNRTFDVFLRTRFLAP